MTGQLGDYDLLEEIGRGGMGVVYRARQRSLGRDVAVKVLPEEVARQGQIAARFRAEAQRMAQLNHPNIAQVYTVGEEGGVQYFAMQYLRGGTLQERLEWGPMAVQDAAAVAAQVADALDYAHRAGIIHRDIKPANILFDDLGRPVVTDFGIAKAVHDLSMTATGASLGTPHYMAPEQIKGGAIDGRADLYALGAMLYEMVCGRPPFGADTPIGVAMKQVSEEPPPLRALCPHVPERLERIIAIALAKDPAHRFATAAEMAAALRSPETVLPAQAFEATAAPLELEAACYVPSAAEAAATHIAAPRSGPSPALIILPIMFALLGLGIVVAVAVWKSGQPHEARQPPPTPSGGLVPSPASIPKAPEGSTPSEPPQTPAVPDVRGRSVDDARAALSQAGYAVEQNSDRPSSDYGAGLVMGQEPPGGTPLAAGSTVLITPSLGPPQEESLSLFSNPAEGYEIKFPTGWAVVQTKEEDYLRTKAASPDGHAVALVDSSQYPYQPDPLSDFRERDQAFAKTATHYKCLLLDYTTVDGRQAGRWEFRRDWQNGLGRTIDVDVQTPGRGYAILVRTYEEEYESYRNLFEAIISSFHVL